MTVNILLARASPRNNIPEVDNCNPDLPCDVLLVKYYFEYPAYKVLRDFFLEHKEYTHLVLATDDIIVRPDHVIQLINDLLEKDYPILCGMMNVDQYEYQLPEGNLNISFEIALKEKKLRHYNWIRRFEIPTDDIFQVKFNGFALMAIKREIIEKYVFACDGVFKPDGKTESGASVDLVFCWYCHENNIPIFVDKRIDMKHLRTEGKIRCGEMKKAVEWTQYQL